MHPRQIATALLVAALAAAAGVLPADEEAPPDVLVLVFNEAGTTSPFDELVGRNVALDLQRAGLGAALAQDAGVPTAGLDPGNPQPIAKRAQSRSAQFAVVVTYAVADREISLRFRAIEAARGIVVAQSQRRAPIDLALDRTISSGMAEILPAVTRGVVRREPRPTGITLPQPPGGPEAPVALEPAAGQPAAGRGEPASPAVPPPVGAGPSVGAPPAGVARGGAFALTAGVGPFLAVGGLGAFVSFGVNPSVSLDYELSPRFAAGLFAGVTGFLASGPLENVQGVLAPAGLDLRYLSNPGSTMSLYFRAAGGPALFAVRTETPELLTKMVPFASLGIGVTRMSSDTSGLSFEAAYFAYLESGELFQGIVPSVNLLRRL